MAKFSVKVSGLAAARAEIARLPKELRGPLLHKLGLDTADEIQERAFAKGLDVRDRQFKWKVSPRERSYLKKTGDLEGSVRYDSGRGRVVGGEGQEGKAEAHQYGRGPAYSKDRRPREWFGVSPAGEKRLNRKTVANVDATIRRWAGSSRHWRVVGKPSRGSKPLRVSNR